MYTNMISWIISENVAKGHPCVQSSTLHNADADSAVDGVLGKNDSPGIFDSRVCAHTRKNQVYIKGML